MMQKVLILRVETAWGNAIFIWKQQPKQLQAHKMVIYLEVLMHKEN